MPRAPGPLKKAASAPGRREANRQAVRARVLEAAERAFSDPGYAATSLRSLLAQTGLLSDSCYAQFKTKEALAARSLLGACYYHAYRSVAWRAFPLRELPAVLIATTRMFLDGVRRR